MARQLAPFASAREIAAAAAADVVDAATLAGSSVNLGTVILTGPLSLTAADTITAKASGVHATATPLTAAVNNVSTVATKADAVMLPVMAAGQVTFVTNSGTADVQVFGAGTSTINAVGTDTGVALAAGDTAVYVAVAAGKIFGGSLT